MKLEQQVVSLELAKRLKELGVKQESFFHWVEVMNADFMENTGSHFELRQNHGVGRDSYAAFTVAELGEMLPDNVKSQKTWAEDFKWRCEREVKGYVSASGGATEAEARGLMLAYLIENNLLSV